MTRHSNAMKVSRKKLRTNVLLGQQSNRLHFIKSKCTPWDISALFDVSMSCMGLAIRKEHLRLLVRVPPPSPHAFLLHSCSCCAGSGLEPAEGLFWFPEHRSGLLTWPVAYFKHGPAGPVNSPWALTCCSRLLSHSNTHTRPIPTPFVKTEKEGGDLKEYGVWENTLGLRVHVCVCVYTMWSCVPPQGSLGHGIQTSQSWPAREKLLADPIKF